MPAPPISASDERSAPASAPAPQLAGRTKVAILLFVSTLFVPSIFFVGPVVLTPTLLYLALGFIPSLALWIAGRAGARTATDTLVLAFAGWAFLTRLILLDVGEALEPAGVILLQTAGAYFAGRVLVQNAAATRLVFGTAVIGVALMLPFLLWESLTGTKSLLNAAAVFGKTLVPTQMDPRWGFQRSQGVFEHPILLGMFVATLLSPVIFMFDGTEGRWKRWLAAPLVVLAAMTSLSTGALLSMNIQFGLTLWNAALRSVEKRWTILIWLVVILYVTADLLSNRTPFHLFVDYATFSAQSSYNRILIWQFGSAAVMDAPLFGHGTDDWERPAFMHASMDNFWLVIAYRYGLPGFLFLAAAFFLTIWRITRYKHDDQQGRDMRLAVIFSLVATMIAAVSVHLWNNSYIWLMFMLGAVAWMARTDDGEAKTPPVVDEEHPSTESRHARLRRLGF
ncbi:O-antigen ligase family protein [Sphingomonas mucosissima]|uniref:O-antigen ligase family protein n=1 Tax=Sphingomonas mucosissima TaxID=370959 RepID=UPI001124FC10|nr:O-antigen ligase family protein [Sphingomonas mucosissima]